MLGGRGHARLTRRRRGRARAVENTLRRLSPAVLLTGKLKLEEPEAAARPVALSEQSGSTGRVRTPSAQAGPRELRRARVRPTGHAAALPGPACLTRVRAGAAAPPSRAFRVLHGGAALSARRRGERSRPPGWAPCAQPGCGPGGRVAGAAAPGRFSFNQETTPTRRDECPVRRDEALLLSPFHDTPFSGRLGTGLPAAPRHDTGTSDEFEKLL